MKKKVKEEAVDVEVTPEIIPEVEPEVTPVFKKKTEKVEKVDAVVVTKGTVIAKMLNVRSGPSTKFLPIQVLYEGDKVEFTEENDDWLKLTNGGFVMSKYIKKKK